MEHEAFSEAGAAPGIEIWTIDKFEPVPIETKMYGKFYNGDSYIVLKTTGDDNTTYAYDAHFWLGSQTTQDKKGSAAILTVTLDDMLGGRAVHHREVQGHESSQFLGYFQPAIRYLEGGNESGFNEVEINAGAEKRLLKLSGCDNMRIEEVPADSSSLTKDNCFILELEHDIYVLMPQTAKATQRRKIISYANHLRDDWHNGRATIVIIDDFSSDDEVSLFFEALGSGSMDELGDDDATQTYTRENISAVYLYRVLQGDEIDLIALSKPYKQTQLSSDEVYILDTPCSGVYVWLGSNVDADVKKSYHELIQQYLDLKGYPSWVHVTRVSEGAESSTFKQYFHSWDTVQTASSSVSVRARISEIDAGYFSGDAEESAASAKLIGKSAAARAYMPDQGEGNLAVTRVTEDTEDITEKIATAPILFQTEVYVVTYNYTTDSDDEVSVVYIWIGSESSPDYKSKALELVSQLDQEGGNLTIVQVPQGKEPKHFLNIFKGNLAILFGNKDDEYKPDNSKKSYDDNGIRLFRVEGTQLGVDMRAVQAPESADVLEDDDVFVLETSSAIYVWNGKESADKEQEAAMNFVKLVVNDDREITSVDQGDEPDEFWEALGGVPEDKEENSGWRQTVSRRVTVPHSLTAVTVTVAGRVNYEELPPEFTQQDLSDDGLYILDTGEELYLWRGINLPERVNAARSKIIEEYIEDDGLDRTVDSTLVIAIKQGFEPAVFKKLFPEWDDDMWNNQTSYADMKENILTINKSLSN